LRDTDSHNAALRAKEAEESKARLQALRRTQRDTDRRTKSGLFAYDDHEDYAAHRRPSKRRKYNHDEDEVIDQDDPYYGEHRQHRERSRIRESRKIQSRDASHCREESSPIMDSRKKHHHRHRSRSPRSESSEEKKSYRSKRSSHRHHRRSRSKSRSNRSRSPRRYENEGASRERSGHHSKSSIRMERSPNRGDRSSSDPLESFLGPLPAKEPIPRGRGARKSSAIDRIFRSDYDPASDVQLDLEEEDEWSMAVETFRDRLKWMKNGANRLRAAGFTEAEVKKWETGKERTEEDVRWGRKGEKREWDRGKVIDTEGDVQHQAEWGRLKDT
jgi:hypothetical protein